MKVNLTSVKSVRKISISDLRNLCIENGYYTCGSDSEYDAMLSKVAVVNHNTPDLTDKLLQELATDIFDHTDVEGITDEYGCTCDDVLCAMLSKIVDVSHSVFVVNAVYKKD